MDNIKETLIQKSKLYATNFLEQFGEFFPFGSAIISDNDSFISVADNIEDEQPESILVIDNLIETFRQLHPEHQFKGVCICINVSVTYHDTNEVWDALEIRVDTINEGPVNCYIPFILENNKVHFFKPYEREGTFSFFE